MSRTCRPLGQVGPLLIHGLVVDRSLPASVLEEDEEDEDGGADERDDERTGTRYNYAWFHVIFIMATMYVAMLLTNWYAFFPPSLLPSSRVVPLPDLDHVPLCPQERRLGRFPSRRLGRSQSRQDWSLARRDVDEDRQLVALSLLVCVELACACRPSRSFWGLDGGGARWEQKEEEGSVYRACYHSTVFRGLDS